MVKEIVARAPKMEVQLALHICGLGICRVNQLSKMLLKQCVYVEHICFFLIII